MDSRGAWEEESAVQGDKCYCGHGDSDGDGLGLGLGRFGCSHGRTLARVGSPGRS